MSAPVDAGLLALYPELSVTLVLEGVLLDAATIINALSTDEDACRRLTLVAMIEELVSALRAYRDARATCEEFDIPF